MNRVSASTRWRVSVEQYYKIAVAGVFAPEDRVELIDRDIAVTASVGTQHATILDLLTEYLVLGINREAQVGPGRPLDLGSYSEPDPGLLVLKRRARMYRDAHPKAEDVLLAIEIEGSSIAQDPGLKRDLYARHGIAEYWVVDVPGSRVWTYRRPAGAVFQEIRELHTADTLSPQSFPTIQIPVAEIFA
jgi:Uma2 family endonuclease